MNITAKQLRLYAVTDRHWLNGQRLEDVVEELLAAGVTCLQLREKHQDPAEFARMARALKPICARYGVPLILNDAVELAKEVDADGVHVGQDDMSVARARAILGPGKIIGASAHNVAEAVAAYKAGADYLGCGAVFGSGTKHNVSQMSLETLTAICQAVDIPVVAIGGVSLDNLPLLAGIGIAGVAVISGLFAAADKTEAAQAFLQQLEGLV